ncbi:hypothetical protein [Rhizobacter sp. P5_C2]
MLTGENFVARLCKASTLDPSSRAPSVASFEFRLAANGQWNDAYLSVDGLEMLPAHGNSFAEKLAHLRCYQIANPLNVQLIRPTRQMAYAVLSVGTIRAARLMDVGTKLDCRKEPRAEGDTHCGVHPLPGVDHWTGSLDDPAHLAVKQYLFLNCCHFERAVPLDATT